MRRFTILFLSFLLVTILLAEKVSFQNEKRNLEIQDEQAIGQSYNWESGSTEFSADSNRDDRSVPGVIDYQGKLTDSSSNPITNNVDITFAIYNISSGGTNLWDETHSNVSPVDGLVHVLLGSIDSFGSTLFDGSDLWLGITVGSDSEMNPRLRIASVPYSMYANNSDLLDGHHADNFMTADTDNWVNEYGDTMTGTLTIDADNCINATSNSSSGYAIRGISQNNCGIRGDVHSSGNYNYYGVMGVADFSGSIGNGKNLGVYGTAYGQSYNYGVYGRVDRYDTNTQSRHNFGIYGLAYCTNPNTYNYGISGVANGVGIKNYGVYGEASGASVNYAGYFNGNVCVTDELQDSDGDAGTNGQILSSTGTGTDWINNPIGGDITAVTAGTGLNGGGVSGDVVLNHEDLSSQSSVNNSNGTVLQDIVIGSLGHVTGIISYNLDSRYYTETEIDANYVHNTDLDHLDASDGSPTDVVYVDNDGDVGIGTTSPGYKLDVDGNVNVTGTANIGDVLHLTPSPLAPTRPSEGDIYVDSDDHHIYCYLNGSWAQLD